MKDRKWKCNICEKFENKNNRFAKKFCSQECFEKAKVKKCKFCGKDFVCSVMSQRYCRECANSSDVKNAKGKNLYFSKKIEKKCKNCGKIIFVRKHVLLCDECKDSLPSPLIHKYDTISRSILCYKCGEKIGDEKIKKSWKTLKNKISNTLCISCKEKNEIQHEIKSVLRGKYLDTESRKKLTEMLERVISLYMLSDNIIENRKIIIKETLEDEISKIKAEKKSNEKLTREALKRDMEIKKNLISKIRREEREKRGIEKEKIHSIRDKIKNDVQNVDGEDGALLEKIKKDLAIEKEKIHQRYLIRKSKKSKEDYHKKEKTEEERLKISNDMSNRMKKNNPMKRKEVSDKVRETIKRKMISGELVYKHGPAHWFWKGNRGFNLDCRNQLYQPWIKKVLERDKFTCTMCGDNKRLHVHHIRPLREIIKTVLDRNNIKDINFFDSKSQEYQKLIENVITEHNMSDGITLCVVCHDAIDEKYRRYKGEGKKNL